MIKTIRPEECPYRLEDAQVKSYVNSILAKYSTKYHPMCVINVGGPASGKTTVSRIYIKKLLSSLNERRSKDRISDFCDINPDNVLSKFYGNNVNCYESKQNPPHKVIDRLFDAAVQKRCHLLYDTTGINTRDIQDRVKTLLHHGYAIYFCICIIQDVNIALQRIEKRVEKSGRMIDKDYFVKRYQDLPKVLRNFYFKLPRDTYEQMIVFDTSSRKPRVVEIL